MPIRRQAVNCRLPSRKSCQDGSIIIDSSSSSESTRSPHWRMARPTLGAPWDLWSHRIKGWRRYRHKQERHLHIIIRSARRDLLLNYIQFKTFIEEELGSTNSCSSIKFNCRRGFPPQHKQNCYCLRTTMCVTIPIDNCYPVTSFLIWNAPLPYPKFQLNVPARLWLERLD